jgi:DNA repair exonuclease SbcCD nuclease subunit
MKKNLTLVHTSDLHLGPDSFPDDALDGFESVMGLASTLKADGLLVAGDLFDSGRSPLEIVQYAFQRFGELPFPVFLLPGNHDVLLTNAGQSLTGLPDLSPNTHILLQNRGELVVLEGLGLSVWGSPVYNHEPSFHPLEGVCSRPFGGWYIVMAHGLVMDEHVGPLRSSPITYDELKQVDCDYIALGHIHTFRDVTSEGAPAFYSGAPSGSQPATVALVTLDPIDGVSVERVLLS